MSEYSEYFLNSRSDIKEFELLSISHPAFTKTYHVVRNNSKGITVTLETAVVQHFDYYPLQIKFDGVKNDLDYSLQIIIGDLGEVLPTELDAVAAAEGYQINPMVIYRTYRSDDLTAPLFGPIELEIESFSFKKEGASFKAKAPSLNLNRTGEYYDLSRFPMLRAFL